MIHQPDNIAGHLLGRVRHPIVRFAAFAMATAVQGHDTIVFGQEIDPSEVRSGSAEFLEYLIGIVYDQMRTSEQPPS